MVNSSNYVQLATNTEAPVTDAMIERFSNPENIRLLHAGLGIASEAGEFVDALKKAMFYGKPLDKVNLAEECSDLCWYIALTLDVLGVSFDSVLETNIKKLAARYPERFTEYHAENRDLETERAILEGKVHDCENCDAQGVCKP